MNLRKSKVVNYNETKILGSQTSQLHNNIKKQMRLPNGFSHFKNELKFSILNALNSKGHGLKRVFELFLNTGTKIKFINSNAPLIYLGIYFEVLINFLKGPYNSNCFFEKFYGKRVRVFN
jgi:hypothetical protein